MDPQLQSLLLQSVPASSARASVIRRRLALAWFFQDNSHLNSEPDRIPLFNKIRKRLEGSDLTIHPSTDFLHLSTFITLLDVAIGDGNQPQIPGPFRDPIKEFNKEVDKLSTVLKGMAADINDTGSANLLRAETKDLLEVFLSRLAYTIRTKAKPRKDIFDGSKRLRKIRMKRNVGRMDEYLARQPENVDVESTHNTGETDNGSELLRYQWEQDLAK